MPTRRDMLFDAKKKGSSSATVIPATVKFKHNKRKGIIEPLSPHEKMLCALRKVLAQLSDRDAHGCRYYIAGNKVQMLQQPLTTAGKKGEPQTYRAAGRCKVRLCHPQGHASSKVIEFRITYRDVTDERGLADVEYIEPTQIEELPRDTPIDVSAVA